MDSPSLRLSEPNRRLEPTNASRFNVSGVYASSSQPLDLTRNLGDEHRNRSSLTGSEFVRKGQRGNGYVTPAYGAPVRGVLFLLGVQSAQVK
jgi:hypothetical protein